MNTPGLRDPFVMTIVARLSLDGCYGRWFVYTTQRHADHCVQVARALCWERVSLTWIPVGTECWSCWSIRSGKYPWCSDLSMRGKNMHSMKARFVLLICKLSPGLSRCSISCRNLVWWAPWDLPTLVTGLGGVCPTIYVKNLGEVIQNYHL